MTYRVGRRLLLFAIVVAITGATIHSSVLRPGLNGLKRTNQPSPQLVHSLVGIVIATNVIKSAPETKFVENVVRSLDLLDIPDAPVVIAMDRTEDRERKAVEEGYIQNLEALCAKERRPCYVEPSPSNLGLLDNIVNSLDTLGPVDNVLVMQGDMPFVSEVPMLKVAEAMKPLDMTYVRFSRWRTGKAAVDLEPVDWGWKEHCGEHPDKQYQGINFFPTNKWYDNTHLVPIDYYRQDFMKQYYGWRTYPEHFMVKLKEENDGTGNVCGDGKMYEYGQRGEGPMTRHKDGREGDDKTAAIEWYEVPYQALKELLWSK